MFDEFKEIWHEEISKSEKDETYFLEGIENLVTKNIFQKLWLNQEEEQKSNSELDQKIA